MLVRSGRCTKTIFERVILCSGSMEDYVTIYENVLQETTLTQNQAQPEKNVLLSIFGRLEEVNALARYAGIKMTNNTPEGKSSHVVYIPFEQSIFELDINRFFIKVERTVRSRLFKMNKISNYGEQDEYLAVWCNETGFDDLEAAQS